MNRIAPEKRKTVQGFSLSPTALAVLNAILVKRLAASGTVRPKRGGRKGFNSSGIVEEAIFRHARHELTPDELTAVLPAEETGAASLASLLQ